MCRNEFSYILQNCIYYFVYIIYAIGDCWDKFCAMKFEKMKKKSIFVGKIK